MKPRMPPGLQRTVTRATELARARAEGPAAAPNVIVPTMPIRTFKPPPAPPAAIVEQQPVGGRGDDYEAARIPFSLPGTVVFSGPAGFSPEVSLFSSVRTWRGCDVFVNVPVLGVDQYLRIRVYSIVQGVRSEIDSALISFDGYPNERQLWVCAARGMGERFEVTAQYYQMAQGAPPAATFNVEVMCSDKCVEQIARDGDQPLVMGGQTWVTGAQSLEMPGVRLVGFTVTNFSAVNAWLLFINGPTTAHPIVSAVGVPPGQSVVQRVPSFQAYGFALGFTLAPSLDPTAYAAAADVAYSVFVK